MTLDLASASGRGEPTLVNVKLHSPTWELNVRATPEELASLHAIRDGDWASRRSLHVGQSVGSRVHWSAAGDNVTIMVGNDDETWDFAVMVPIDCIGTIVAEVAAEHW